MLSKMVIKNILKGNKKVPAGLYVSNIPLIILYILYIVFWDILALVNNWPNSPLRQKLSQVMQTQHIPIPVCLICVF